MKATMMIGQIRGSEAPVRALYVDGELRSTFCKQTTARDLATQIKLCCGTDELTEVRCDVTDVTKFPQTLPRTEPLQVVVEPEPEVLSLSVEGAVDENTVVLDTHTTDNSGEPAPKKAPAKKRAPAKKKAPAKSA